MARKTEDLLQYWFFFSYSLLLQLKHYYLEKEIGRWDESKQIKQEGRLVAVGNRIFTWRVAVDRRWNMCQIYTLKQWDINGEAKFRVEILSRHACTLSLTHTYFWKTYKNTHYSTLGLKTKTSKPHNRNSCGWDIRDTSSIFPLRLQALTFNSDHWREKTSIIRLTILGWTIL